MMNDEIRALALSHAMDLGGRSGWGAQEVLKAAAEFEAYLLGKKPEANALNDTRENPADFNPYAGRSNSQGEHADV